MEAPISAVLMTRANPWKGIVLLQGFVIVVALVFGAGFYTNDAWFAESGDVDTLALLQEIREAQLQAPVLEIAVETSPTLPGTFTLSCRNGVERLRVRSEPRTAAALVGTIPPTAILKAAWDAAEFDTGGNEWVPVRYEAAPELGNDTGALIEGWAMSRTNASYSSRTAAGVFLLSANSRANNLNSTCASDRERTTNEVG